MHRSLSHITLQEGMFKSSIEPMRNDLTFVLVRNGGGIFHGMCNVVEKIRSRCFWVGLSMSPEAIIVLLQNNLAHGNFVFI